MVLQKKLKSCKILDFVLQKCIPRLASLLYAQPHPLNSPLSPHYLHHSSSSSPLESNLLLHLSYTPYPPSPQLHSYLTPHHHHHRLILYSQSHFVLLPGLAMGNKVLARATRHHVLVKHFNNPDQPGTNFNIKDHISFTRSGT